MTSKFHNRPTVNLDGIRFASKKEAARYEELRLLEMAGQIWNLERQTRWPLYACHFDLPPTKVCDYVADFDYDERAYPNHPNAFEALARRHVTEDTKGVRTTVYRLKAKLFTANYGYAIRET